MTTEVENQENIEEDRMLEAGCASIGPMREQAKLVDATGDLREEAELLDANAILLDANMDGPLTSEPEILDAILVNLGCSFRNCSKHVSDKQSVQNMIAVICKYNEWDILSSWSPYDGCFVYQLSCGHLTFHIYPDTSSCVMNLCVNVPRNSIGFCVFGNYKVNDKSIYEIYQFVAEVLEADLLSSSYFII